MIVYNDEQITNALLVEWIRKKLFVENVRTQRLQEYFDGKQDILRRVFADSTKPNNRIVENYCKEISEFLTAYLVGVPVEYKNAPQIILDVLNYNDNDNTTQIVTLNMNNTGIGAELFYTDADGVPRFTSIDPQEIIFIFDNTLEQNLTHAIRIIATDDIGDGYEVTLYDSVNATQYDLSLAIGVLQPLGEPTPHYYGDVPVILYVNNDTMKGSFEGVISLQNAINVIASDEVNDFEAFVNSYLVLEGMKGTTEQDLENMKRNRILLTDRDTRAYWLTKEGGERQNNVLKAELKKTIRELGSIPDVQDLGSFGSSGVALQFKLIKTETAALKQERSLFKGIQRKLELLYNILRLTDSSIGLYTEIEPIFQRNFIMFGNEQEKTKEDTTQNA